MKTKRTKRMVDLSCQAHWKDENVINLSGETVDVISQEGQFAVIEFAGVRMKIPKKALRK